MSSIRMPKQSRRKENANKFHAQTPVGDEISAHNNIGAGLTVENFNFNRKMVCQHHITVDLEHRLLGLGESQMVDEDTVPTECVHRKTCPRPSGVAMAREERSGYTYRHIPDFRYLKSAQFT